MTAGRSIGSLQGGSRGGELSDSGVGINGRACVDNTRAYTCNTAGCQWDSSAA